jgi:hypothetical protein
MTVRGMRIACWVPKAIHPYLQYATLTAFPLQQWQHERASMLRYTYIACLIIYHYQPHNYCLLISDLMKLWTEESDRREVRRTDKRMETACV